MSVLCNCGIASELAETGVGAAVNVAETVDDGETKTELTVGANVAEMVGDGETGDGAVTVAINVGLG